VNEDLAATAIWGSQQLNLSPGAKYDGVVGIWYGKGPGVDRCGDVFRHGNAAGSAKNGGVLCLAGDDHGAKSSTVPHQSDHAFISALMPYLYPSSIHEMIEMGLLGYRDVALFRLLGRHEGDHRDGGDHRRDRSHRRDEAVRHPDRFRDAAGRPQSALARRPLRPGPRLQDYKGFAAIAFARANKVNRITMDSPNARFGIMASGKSYEDIRQALRELGITERSPPRSACGSTRSACPGRWSRKACAIRGRLEEIFIVEERREIVENQVKQELFNWRDDVRPRIVGKMDEHDKRFLPFAEELSVASLASSLTERLLRLNLNPEIAAMLRAKADWFNGRQATQMQRWRRSPARRISARAARTTPRPRCRKAAAPLPASAATSWRCGWTATPRPSPIWAARACRGSASAPFTKKKHVFANLGDGTYFHSGSLAIRQAVASGANITYKILYNDATAMTGGQHVDGELSPQQITFQLHAEGIREIYLVSENPDAYPASEIAPGRQDRASRRARRGAEDLREVKGASAIVFVQTCAAEKRRRRKRGTMEDPPRRV
jgi:indolepyruvate ferredoxin oxidoreductase